MLALSLVIVCHLNVICEETLEFSTGPETSRHEIPTTLD
jgi:hypothetical protein